MVDEGSPLIMRIRALVLTALVILSSITSVIASDTVTTQDVEISGNHTMTGNYTVSKGTTLTLKSGTTIDMGNYWLKVDGNLVADNTTIMSSIQTTGAGSHNAGVWDSLTISSTGSASLDNVTVSNAKSCLIVDGLLQAKHLAVADCLIGIEVAGSATIEDFMANDVDIDGLRVTGDADISDGELSLEGEYVPTAVSVSQNYPNPFNPSTSFNVNIPHRQRLSIDIISINGKHIKKITNNIHEQGIITFHWDGKTKYGELASSGQYFIVVKGIGFQRWINATLLK